MASAVAIASLDVIRDEKLAERYEVLSLLSVLVAFVCVFSLNSRESRIFSQICPTGRGAERTALEGSAAIS